MASLYFKTRQPFSKTENYYLYSMLYITYYTTCYTSYLPKQILLLCLGVLIFWAGTTLPARRSACFTLRCPAGYRSCPAKQKEGKKRKRRNTCTITTAFRNKIYSNFKQRIYFRRKIWKSISIRYFCSKGWCPAVRVGSFQETITLLDWNETVRSLNRTWHWASYSETPLPYPLPFPHPNTHNNTCIANDKV